MSIKMPSAPARVVAAETQRCAAMAAGDLDTLERLLHPDLRYGHTSGLWDTKAEYLSKLGEGRLIYHSSSSTITGYLLTGPVALVWVDVKAEVTTPAGRRHMHNTCLTAWVTHAGRPQMIAHQPTVLPAETSSNS